MSLKEPDVHIKPSLNRLKGKVAIVTGSTSGIGKATAMIFAAEGAKVVVTGRRLKQGQKIVNEIINNGGEATFVQGDITVDTDIKNLIDTTLVKYSQIDILVNNAGRIIEKLFLEYSDADWDNFVALDARSYFKCMQMVLPHMEKSGTGAIVNVTSLSAIKAAPIHALYNFCKAGITHMTRSVALEYAAKGIRVNALLSGAVLTEMIADNPNTDMMIASIPMGRASTAAEQAYAALFLASDDASYITGALLVVDGGIIT